MTSFLSTNAPIVVSNTTASGYATTLTLTPSNNAIHAAWTVVPPESADSSILSTGGYLMVIDRLSDIHIINLNTVEVAAGSYTITNLDGDTAIVNGTTYLVQYVQIMSDSSHISTLTATCVPHSVPLALTLLEDVPISNVAVDESTMSVTVSVNNPNSSSSASKITFKLVQWHPEDSAGSSDDPNASGGMYVGDDILTFTKDVTSYADGTTYTLDLVPKGHYKCCAVCINSFGISPVSNIVDVYAFSEPNNFDSFQVVSGQGATIPFTFSLTDNPNARVETVVATLLNQLGVQVASKNITVLTGTSDNAWTINSLTNVISGYGVFTADDGVTLGNGYTVQLVAKTAAEGSGDDDHGKMNDPVTSTGVALECNYVPSVDFYPDDDIDAAGYIINGPSTTVSHYYSVTGTDSGGNNVAGLAQTYITTNSNTIDSQYVLDGTYVTATAYDIIPPLLVGFWAYPSLTVISSPTAASLFAHDPVSSDPLVIELQPEHVTMSLIRRDNSSTVLGLTFKWNANTKPTNINIFAMKTSYGDLPRSDTNNVIGDSIIDGWNYKVDIFGGIGVSVLNTSPHYMEQPMNHIYLEDGAEYKFWILQVNENSTTPGMTSDSLTYTFDHYPPELASVSYGQVGYTKSATLQGVLSTEIGDWSDLSPVADITVTSSSGSVLSSLTDVAVESLYTLTELEYNSVVTILFKTKAKHSLFPNPIYEYSQGQTVSFTVEPYEAPSPEGLTWSQNGYANNGTISFTPISGVPSGATVAYTYYITDGGANLGDVSISTLNAANGSVNIPSVTYNVEQVLTLVVSVTYNDYTTTNSSSVSFTAYPYEPPAPEGLTWTQNGYANNGTISFTPISGVPSGATVTYKYAIVDDGVNLGLVTISSSDAANGSFNIPSVTYNVAQVVILQVFVTYNYYLTTNSSSVSFVVYPYEVPAPDGLTWTQNGTEDDGTITWDAISGIPSGATVAYKYSILNNGVNLGDVSISTLNAANCSVNIPLVQYNVLQVLTVVVTVTYSGYTSTNSSSVTYTPAMPELSITSFTYTRGTPYTQSGILRMRVLCALGLSNGYVIPTGNCAKVAYRVNYGNWVPGYTTGFDTGSPIDFGMAMPSNQELRVMITAELANGTFPNATKTSDWTYDAGVTWTMKPTITLDSASAISATSSSITYTILNNGSNLNGTLVLAIPTSSTNASSIVTVDTGPFVWSQMGVQASRTLTSTFAYNIFPSGSTNKDDISVLIAASNGDGFTTFEQGLSPI